jgi:hypothetical protein
MNAKILVLNQQNNHFFVIFVYHFLQLMSNLILRFDYLIIDMHYVKWHLFQFMNFFNYLFLMNIPKKTFILL